MIQTKGNILQENGVSQWVNPLINIYYANPMAGSDTNVVCQVAKWLTPETKEEQPVLQIIEGLTNFSFPTSVSTDFKTIQGLVLKGLQEQYPDCTFTIV